MPLDDADVRSLLDVPAVLATDPAPEFEAVLAMLMKLIPCESASFNDMTLATGDFRYVIAPAGYEILAQRLKPEYDRFAHQHPLIARALLTPTSGAMRFCDVPAEPPFIETDLYRYFFEPFGIRYQLVIQLPSPPDVLVGYALNRSAEQGEFSDRDVEMLNALGGNLAMHHRVVMHAGRSRAMADEADRDGWAVLTVRSSGVIEASSATSLSPALTSGQSVPVAIARLLPSEGEVERGTTSHDVTIGDERWRCVVQPVPAGPTVLLIRRLGDEPAEATHLRDVGLTPRQTDVAVALARTGDTNAQLARTLGMSEGTVKKHLEAVFRVLGVDNRGAAVVALRSHIT